MKRKQSGYQIQQQKISHYWRASAKTRVGTSAPIVSYAPVATSWRRQNASVRTNKLLANLFFICEFLPCNNSLYLDLNLLCKEANQWRKRSTNAKFVFTKFCFECTIFNVLWMPTFVKHLTLIRSYKVFPLGGNENQGKTHTESMKWFLEQDSDFLRSCDISYIWWRRLKAYLGKERWKDIETKLCDDDSNSQTIPPISQKQRQVIDVDHLLHFQKCQLQSLTMFETMHCLTCDWNNLIDSFDSLRTLKMPYLDEMLSFPKNLTSLHLIFSTNVSRLHLEPYFQLRTIALQGWNVISWISLPSSLRNFEVSPYCKIEEINSLSNMKVKILKMNVQKTNHLKHISFLERLQLYQGSYLKHELIPLLTHLTSLTIQNVTRDITFDPLFSLTNLRFLRLHCIYEIFHLAPLNALTWLTQLYLCGFPSTFFSQQQPLNQLQLPNTRILCKLWNKKANDALDLEYPWIVKKTDASFRLWIRDKAKKFRH
jgi:hypothetical protein